MKKLAPKLILLVIAACLIFLFFHFDLGRHLTFEALKSKQLELENFYLENQALTIGAYFLIYVLTTALNLPGATILTLAGGAIFGVLMGTIIVSFASTMGATGAFLMTRYLIGNTVQKKYGRQLKSINAGIDKEGAYYLFTLRLVPLFPFFLINLVMGLTRLKTSQFYLVSQLGMFPGTIVYVNAGTQLSQLESLSGILSPAFLFSFALLGIFPIVAKKGMEAVKARKYLKRYSKPSKFDYNVIAIGAGSAGLVSAYIAAAVKAKVALIEKHKMGGDCLNTGCVPSKAIIKTARILHQAKRAKEYGLARMDAEFNFADVMARVQRVIKTIEPHDSVERYTGLGVDCIQGNAKITSPYEVEVDGKKITTKNIIVATGARPFVPPIEGLNEIPYLTSDTVWELREQPKHLVVLGGGPIGSELTQAFARLGSKVTQIEMLPRIMSREDPEISEAVMKQFRSEGIDVKTEHKAKKFGKTDSGYYLIAEHKGQDVRIEFDQVLVAIGRKANVKGFGLEELEVQIAKQGTIEHNDFLQTNYPNIYVCGDVAGPYQFTHTAAHQAWFAAVNALFSPLKKFKADYRVIPWATFTDPEVARVGLNETEAKEQGVEYEVTEYGIDDLDRAIADEEAHGVVKVLTVPGKDQILGVTIMGDHAGDLIAEYVAAMKHGFGLNKILGTIHIYPTLAEANKYAAGVWKKAHAPQKALEYLQKFHTWRRS